ncbi:glycosyltransferase [Peribacillus cavernae]|uniref:Glycosyltransferase n=1 Tax=Peribacillus cavernae TaxID=1674310 RepID=A0A433HJH3_9BACI|nr:glycosyltransferase [Peribacillus cavernae]MDQ0219204.1 processive 1,2-diacylglycerol beta-glucosyltransferase [Peribacillus cavernae]RUQ28576.1 glycosyltransferase [Peribacillus cavernae]
MRRPSALILTANYGSGHLQAAKVIAEELNNKGFEPVVSDLFGESYPIVSTFTQSLLIKSFSYGPSFYKWLYYGTNKLHYKGLAQFSRYLGRKRLLELITKYRPQFIISTFPLHSAPFLMKQFGYFIPTYTVITDYCVHPYWINPLINHYFVASDAVKNILLEQDMQEKRITVSGIPIRPQFEKQINKRAVFEKYQLSPWKKVITVLAGANGVLRNVKELCLQLLKDPTHQIVVICGDNEDLHNRLLPLSLLFPGCFHVFGYVEEIYELLAISNCLITKPGGIALSEAASLQVPLILFKPVPGQETENARHFTENGAAVVSHSVMETFEQIQTLSRNKEMITNMKRELAKIHKAHSVTVITDYAIDKTKQKSAIIR